MSEATERALLAERILAEQDERRRLAELIHDRPVQHLAAITQMVDAALDAVRAGDLPHADELLTRSLALAREAAQDLRALGEDLEPRALRELGFSDALEALARRTSARRELDISLDVGYADELGEHAQLGLFQIAREAIEQAIRRGALERLDVRVTQTARGGAELTVSDDGPPERRSAVLELLAERAATLNGRFTSEARWPRGSTIRVELPPSAARR